MEAAAADPKNLRRLIFFEVGISQKLWFGWLRKKVSD
jgi:hypothetical protein